MNSATRDALRTAFIAWTGGLHPNRATPELRESFIAQNTDHTPDELREFFKADAEQTARSSVLRDIEWKTRLITENLSEGPDKTTIFENATAIVKLCERL